MITIITFTNGSAARITIRDRVTIYLRDGTTKKRKRISQRDLVHLITTTQPYSSEVNGVARPVDDVVEFLLDELNRREMRIQQQQQQHQQQQQQRQQQQQQIRPQLKTTPASKIDEGIDPKDTLLDIIARAKKKRIQGGGKTLSVQVLEMMQKEEK